MKNILLVSCTLSTLLVHAQTFVNRNLLWLSANAPGGSLLTRDEIILPRKAEGVSALYQNRAWAGIVHKFFEWLNARLIYLNVIQQRNSAMYDQIHVVRGTLQFNFASKAATAS